MYVVIRTWNSSFILSIVSVMVAGGGFSLYVLKYVLRDCWLVASGSLLHDT